MKKRLLSILLALCMVICLVPTSVFAESETNKKVETEQELVEALSDSSTDIISLKNDIAISTTLNITRAVTLDLVGYMLEMTGSGSVIKIADGGHLTLKDSDPTSTYYFTPNSDGLWKWGTSGTKTVRGGVIYGGTGTKMYYSTYGGSVLIEPGGAFTMNGGSIVGCKADGAGGGVVVQCGDANGIFTMNSGAIIGCVAESGGGVETDGGGVGEYGQFIMNGGVIDSCVANGRTGGGGVRNDGLFIMGKDATIKNCKAVENGQRNIGSGIVLAGDERQTIGGTIISEDAVDEKYIFMNRSTMAIGENANIHANITLAGGKIDLDGSRATVYGKITNDSYGGVSCFADGLVTVTYKVSGEDYAVQVLRSGSFATQPIEPTKTGYEFDGWFTSDGTKWDCNTAVTENITLTGYLSLPVASESELEAALADDTVEVIKLKDNTNTVITLEITRAVTLDLNGCILSMMSNIRVKSGGHLTLIDSNPTVEHRFVSDNGLWKLYENSGIETVNGGVIYGGKGITDRNSNGYGGGVYIYDGGRFTMIGGNIVGCKAEGYIAYGGGVFVAKGGAFTMTGGSITGCTAVAQGYGMAFGGGIRNDGESNNSNVGRTTLSGTAVIRDCHAKGVTDANQMYGGGISDAGTLTISGDVTFIGCTADGYGSDAMYVNANNDSSIMGGTFYGSVDDPGNKISGITVTYCLNNDENYATQVLQQGDQITLPDPAKPGCTFNGWYKGGTKWEKTTPVTENRALTGWLYIPVTSEAELRAALADDTADVIRLTKDIDISSSLTVNRKVTLDLGGYVLQYTDTTANGSVFKIVSGGDLTVIDSRPDAEHRFNSDNILWAPDEQNGKEIVMGGVITGGTGTPCYVNGSSYFVACGGGVYLEGDARFTMDGGNIVGCIANTGGGVHISENGSFTMNGGSIMGCSSWDLSGPNGTPYFGGVYLDSGTFTMTGGVIKDCAKYSVVLNENATMNANGGEIYGVVEVGKNSYVTGLDGIAGVTVFRDNFWIYHNSARVDWGIFYGSITNYYDDPIIGLTVTYMNGETIYARQILPSGTLATRPDAPTTTPGYTFGGWNKADGTAWDYASDKVTDNITLYAKWIANTYTVTFDTAGGTEIAPITQGYGTAITAPAAPTKEGYTFVGWDKSIPTTMPAENITITAQWKINKYTITFDTAGGTEIAPITQDYGTQIASPAAPTREGYNFVGWDKSIPATMPAENITITAQWKDTEKPTGEIIIGTNKWQSFLNKLTFGLFFKDTQEVTINAADNSGAVFISYFVTDQDLSEAELESLVYYAYDEPFCIDPNGEYIIYAMLVDESLNITYLRSDRITLDNVRPVITGIENGKTYCEAQTVSIDEKYADTVTVNGTEIELNENGSFVLSPADGEQKIIAADKAGNTAEITVTVNDGHTFGEWKSNGDGTHTRKCTADGCNSCETKNCSGGKATCAEKAICELCGKAYGELNASNHTNLVSFPAKAATTNAEGNIEYWRCEGCGKYFADSAGTKEITAKDMVTGKLPSDKKSPQTGASGMLALCAALLLASGGTAAVISTRKKKKFGKAE
ncbi:InlB B-repeat-containing protein [Ruminococcus sp.]|uniref:InlB B-repeat-containing protein n=1 Tax=Ruminococcus sp. TaxID=41978 RepID=UPI003FD8EBD1